MYSFGHPKSLFTAKMTFFDCTRFQLKNKKMKIQTHPPVFDVKRPNKPLVLVYSNDLTFWLNAQFLSILNGMNVYSQNANNRRPKGTKAVSRRVLRQFSAFGSLDFENLRARTATLS